MCDIAEALMPECDGVCICEAMVWQCRGEETMWDVFMDQFEVLATKAPVMLVAGNHERDFPSSGDRYNTAEDSGKLTNPLPGSKLYEQPAAN